MIASEKVKRLEGLLGRVAKRRDEAGVHLRFGFEAGARRAGVSLPSATHPAHGGSPPSTRDFGEPASTPAPPVAIVAAPPTLELGSLPMDLSPPMELMSPPMELAPPLLELVPQPPVEEEPVFEEPVFEPPAEEHVAEATPPAPPVEPLPATPPWEPTTVDLSEVPLEAQPQVMALELEPVVSTPDIEVAIPSTHTAAIIAAEALVEEPNDVLDEPTPVSVVAPAPVEPPAEEAVAATPAETDEVADVQPWEVESVPPTDDRPTPVSVVAPRPVSEPPPPVIQLADAGEFSFDEEVAASEPITHPVPTPVTPPKLIQVAPPPLPELAIVPHPGTPLEPEPAVALAAPEPEAITEPKPAFEPFEPATSPRPEAFEPPISAALELGSPLPTDIADESTAVSESESESSAIPLEPAPPSEPTVVTLRGEEPDTTLDQPPMPSDVMSAGPPTAVSFAEMDDDPDAITSKMLRKDPNSLQSSVMTRRRSRPPPLPREVSSTQVSEGVVFDADEQAALAEPPPPAEMEAVSAEVFSAPVDTPTVVATQEAIAAAEAAAPPGELEFVAPPPPEPAAALAQSAPSLVVIAPLTATPTRVAQPVGEFIGEVEGMKPSTFGAVIDATLSLSLPVA